MYLHRSIDNELIKWKNSSSKKPLMIRGARQVGKSSTIRNLGRQFSHYIEINFDEQAFFSKVFEENTVFEICEQIEALTGTPIVAGETLLFLDEIQTSLAAIGSLRYFYEKMPELHVIAAGSLLEFALSELPSFGVGRIRSLYMYPFSFEEFLLVHQEKKLLTILQKANENNPLPPIIHKKLSIYFRKFLIVGGMPEAVNTYVQTQSLLEVQTVLDDLINSFQADFTKYKTKIDTGSILQVFRAIVQQVGQKLSYSYPESTLKNDKIKEILELLRMAGLVYFVTHSASNGIPLGAEINPKMKKIILFDTGIFQRLLGLDMKDLLLEDEVEVINKGNIAELHVGLELIKNSFLYQNPELFYWQRDAKNSQAEVDFVIQKGEKIIPIEVKSGKKGSMQSLFLFLGEKKTPYGIRISMENFSAIDKVKIIPLYGIQNLFLPDFLS